MTRLLSFRAVFALFLSATLPSAVGGTIFNITDIGPGAIAGFNDQGVVLGNDSTGAFVYRNGARQYLPDPSHGSFVAKAINNAGLIAGYIIDPSVPSGVVATYSAANGYTVVPQIGAGDNYALNDSGHLVVGSRGRGVVVNLSAGVVSSIDRSGPVGIDANGNVIAEFGFSLGQSISEYAPDGTPIPLALPPDPTFPGIAIQTFDANLSDSGGIAASFHPIFAQTTQNTVFLYDASGFHSLGLYLNTPPEADTPTGINNSDWIVGNTFVSGSPQNIGWLWTPVTGFQNLNDAVPANSGWVLDMPAHINNNDQIVGIGTLNGVRTNFLLSPQTAAVPEPGSLSLAGAGFIFLLGFAFYVPAGASLLR